MEHEKKNMGFFESLSGKMLSYTVIPLIILAVLVGFVGSTFCKRTMISMVESEMSKECQYLENTMNSLYPGDYSWEVISDESFKLYKGDYEITNENEELDEMHSAFDNEFAIYLGQVSVLTSCTDEEGNRYILSEAPTVVRTSVIENGETKFYSNVTVAGEKCFAYFKPIISSDGNSYGMYAVFHSAAELNKRVLSVIIPLYVLCFIAVLVLGFFSTYYSQKIVDKILVVKRFMESVSSGRLNTEMNPLYLAGNDELAVLARSSVEMQASLRKMIDYDALTEISNRRFANIYIEKMHEESGIRSDYCITIGDIDFFKNVNDTYGHDAGDAVLKYVADILRKNVPPKDLVARWGGEEFIFAFNEKSMDEAYIILRNCLTEIRNNSVYYNGENIQVTMSFGLARAEKERTADIVIMQADNLLYEAKETGRNKIVVEK
ncbi:MAG: diguanylate cyclase [Eubacterium sp.]|nr:diguanylate cyclase [Eubacterium sp.]